MYGKNHRMSDATGFRTQQSTETTPFREKKAPIPRREKREILSSAGQDVVGRRIKVWWPDDRAWYSGTVTKFVRRSRKHVIEYDDGEVETVVLHKERVKFIVPRPRDLSSY
jgi:hypothetical protein